MRDWIADVLRGRPLWMNVLMGFSAFMAFLYMPWDFFVKPVAGDEEVWFGIMFRGWAAKLMEIPHWFVYGAATYGFRRMRPWMRTWGAAYVAQIAFGMFVWTAFEFGGFLGFLLGFFPALPFAALALALWNADEHFTPKRTSLRERYGEWAIITGASAGIGREFARALACDGVSCVLVARREEQLNELAAELEKGYNVSTRVVRADLADPASSKAISAACEGLDVGVVIANAGLGYSGRFDKQDPERLAQLVAVNCAAPMLLAAEFLPGMRERGRGALILTGSVAGHQPLPLHAVYSATKAFDSRLGEALYVENRAAGVDVLVLEPGSTESEFHDVAGELPHPGEPAAKVVQVALDALGKQPSVVSGWMNWLRATFAARLGSRPLVAYVARDVMATQTPRDMQ